jgi:hypothetical protein
MKKTGRPRLAEYVRYKNPPMKTAKEQHADAVETLIGTMSDQLFCKLKESLTAEEFLELRGLLARRINGDGRDV